MIGCITPAAGVLSVTRRGGRRREETHPTGLETKCPLSLTDSSMKLADLIPDPDFLIALEPDELGLRMLPRHGAFQLRRIEVRILSRGADRIRTAGRAAQLFNSRRKGKCKCKCKCECQNGSLLVRRLVLYPLPGDHGHEDTLRACLNQPKG
jgi:hypothetical protein